MAPRPRRGSQRAGTFDFAPPPASLFNFSKAGLIATNGVQ
ncbi:hypothetical protein FTUN_3072 [Frigoriglobus tundricola]|uniref:Uncharacterized protein n=1 Tax=Frigoriglobus tundricola TaxID=2774151 RepID=A0A6M5YQE5_9BACT|nr:hypothetical protein FTUN_3072 [Frigoriglobus tundricola]